LGELFISCVPDTGWVYNDDLIPAFLLDETCFELSYPVNLVDFEGNEYTVTNVEEFIDLISTNDMLFFSWPLNVIDEDGNIHSLNSADEFFELMFSCEEYDNPCDSTWFENDSIYYGVEYLGCYEIVFPISVYNENGEVVELADADALMNLIFNGGYFTTFVYPFQLLDLEGNVITVEDEAQLNELMADCWDDPFVGSGQDIMFFFFSTAAMGDDACYSINYPITVESWDSSYNQINSDQEFMEYMNANEYFALQYPVSITYLEDNSVFTLNSSEDIESLIETCDQGWTGGGEHADALLFFFSSGMMGEEACYDIVYPITVELWDSTATTINSDLEFMDLFNQNEFFTIQYPVTVVLNDGSGSEAILNHQEDLFELINDCQG
jgi:hypothetical protein